MDIIEISDLVIIGSPDGGQAGRFGCHNIHTDTKICTQFLYARSDKFHDFILYIAIFKDSSDDRQSNVLRTDTFHRLTVQINRYHTRHIDIVSFGEQLFYKLRSAFAHRHGSQCTVTCVGV